MQPSGCVVPSRKETPDKKSLESRGRVKAGNNDPEIRNQGGPDLTGTHPVVDAFSDSGQSLETDGHSLGPITQTASVAPPPHQWDTCRRSPGTPSCDEPMPCDVTDMDPAADTAELPQVVANSRPQENANPNEVNAVKECLNAITTRTFADVSALIQESLRQALEARYRSDDVLPAQPDGSRTESQLSQAVN